MEEIILKEREFKEKLVQVVNSSEMPAFIIKSDLKELYEQIALLEQQQYEQAKINKQNKEEADAKN